MRKVTNRYFTSLLRTTWPVSLLTTDPELASGCPYTSKEIAKITDMCTGIPVLNCTKWLKGQWQL